MEEALATQVQRYLDGYVYENARFLAERLVAHHPSEENALLLATCYYRNGQAARASAVLIGCSRPENRYLLARCCFEQGKLVEAENALLGGENCHIDDADAMENVPAGAAGLYLLGHVCRRGNRRQQAIACFVKSLETDPFMWSAYEQLCELGANLEASRFFGAANYFNSIGPTDEASDELDSGPESSDRSARGKLRFGGEEGEYRDDNNVEDRSTDGTFATPEPPPHLGLATPKSVANPASSSSKPLAHKTPNVNSNNGINVHTATVVKKPRVAEDIGAPVRQRKAHRRPLTDSDEKFRAHARLSFSAAGFDDSPLNPSKLALSSPTSHLPTRPFYQDKTPLAGSSHNRVPSHQMRGRHELLRLLSSFGSIYQKLSVYMCREALEMLERLPPSQHASGWVQQQIGRAHFEMADYVRAHEVFCTLHRSEPHRMEGLDLYSTTLWHLKKEVELSYLAQQATDFDKLSCEAWCAAGNCFSLQKEHDTALAFFQRAIQLDPSFAYAYTLSGHEYVANEDFEKAVNCYRHAIRADSRHYNAWYGLGTIYYRQEKFEFAEYHFRRALEINPRSSLLHCFLGMVLHATHRYDEALDALAIAAELQPLNPQARFQRANVLITQQRFEEALKELHVVKNFAPRESSVHFMMGKVTKKLGRIEEAMKYFTLALRFHPKDNNQIKVAIDKINEPGHDDDDRM
ncbi:Cell division cycle protein 27 [Phytophthora fragariae]|uniref:Cell division cycle protein 27 n=1 Tax=Phytophthora fragariae TaxID=53985 RepID=A0A6A3KJ40_9STRA|nr:Cell division cycle protein 27 [Phytophthora fragariae]KAE8933725.1 Cell division cycle protein 27 [Phytophthora fragariae]KAE9003773.1 Cell division cycle protein 27 [Phytophthora fragariae]KAE9100219.1 Cell division cycle protein 27 [Phytophthora fragariae]KAE9147337.1 Cell division cycle protein 27 [Phytophthora fragariae]